MLLGATRSKRENPPGGCPFSDWGFIMTWKSLEFEHPSFSLLEEYRNSDMNIDPTDYHIVKSSDVIICKDDLYYCGRYCEETCPTHPEDGTEYYWEIHLPNEQRD